MSQTRCAKSCPRYKSRRCENCSSSTCVPCAASPQKSLKVCQDCFAGYYSLRFVDGIATLCRIMPENLPKSRCCKCCKRKMGSSKKTPAQSPEGYDSEDMMETETISSMNIIETVEPKTKQRPHKSTKKQMKSSSPKDYRELRRQMNAHPLNTESSTVVNYVKSKVGKNTRDNNNNAAASNLYPKSQDYKYFTSVDPSEDEPVSSKKTSGRSSPTGKRMYSPSKKDLPESYQQNKKLAKEVSMTNTVISQKYDISRSPNSNGTPSGNGTLHSNGSDNSEKRPIVESLDNNKKTLPKTPLKTPPKTPLKTPLTTAPTTPWTTPPPSLPATPPKTPPKASSTERSPASTPTKKVYKPTTIQTKKEDKPRKHTEIPPYVPPPSYSYDSPAVLETPEEIELPEVVEEPVRQDSDRMGCNFCRMPTCPCLFKPNCHCMHPIRFTCGCKAFICYPTGPEWNMNRCHRHQRR